MQEMNDEKIVLGWYAVENVAKCGEKKTQKFTRLKYTQKQQK